MLMVAVLISISYSQTPDDDEVDIHIPNYPHKIYSGTNSSIKAIFSLILFENPKSFTTYFILPRLTKLQIL